MASKFLLAPSFAAALLLAGCATARKEATPPQPVTQTVAIPATRETPDKPALKRKPQTASRTASPRKTPPPVPAETTRAALPGMIGSGATWSVPGQSLAVSRGGAASSQPVPLFRQAGTLASVRAALAGSPAQPQAEFRNGVLTLKFDRGSNEEIAAAVKKTLTVTGNRDLRVALQP